MGSDKYTSSRHYTCQIFLKSFYEDPFFTSNFFDLVKVLSLSINWGAIISVKKPKTSLLALILFQEKEYKISIYLLLILHDSFSSMVK